MTRAEFYKEMASVGVSKEQWLLAMGDHSSSKDLFLNGLFFHHKISGIVAATLKWKDTPQGEDFWSDVVRKLNRLEM